MAELFLVALGIILFLLLLQQLEYAETKLLVKTLKWTVIVVLVCAGIYLTLVGRLFHVAAIIVLLTLLLRQDMYAWVKKRSPLPLAPPLNRAEAAKILKVNPNASPEEIQGAFERTTPKDSTHYDRLLQAREILLKKKKNR
jgi:hypothetical protein